MKNTLKNLALVLFLILFVAAVIMLFWGMPIGVCTATGRSLEDCVFLSCHPNARGWE